MKTLVVLFALAQGADLGTTALALGRGCHEGNPTLSRAPLGRIATVKGSAVGMEFSVAWGAHKRGHDKAAKAILWTGIVAGSVAAVWNGRQAMRCAP